MSAVTALIKTYEKVTRSSTRAKPRVHRRYAKRMTLDKAIKLAERALKGGAEKGVVYSCFKSENVTRAKSGRRVGPRGAWRHNLTTDTATGYTNRRDWQSKAMAMGPSFAFATATGTATASSATTLTNTGASFPTAGQALAGQMVIAALATGFLVYGIIVSNSGTVLTVDQWYDPASTSGAAGTTPSATGKYVIVPGQGSASWMAVTENAVAPAASDTTLTAELAADGFTRAVGTYSHTAAASTYSLQHLFTATGTRTINKEAIFGAANVTGGGVMPFESAEPSPPTLVSGDTLTQTVTVTIN